MWEPGWVDGEQKQAFAVVPAGTQEDWNSYRIMRTVEDFYDKVFTENGGRYLFDAPLTGLVMDDGAVVGVEMEQDGEKAYVKANKGVILACGGFTNNIAMLKAYCPRGFSGVMVNTAGIYDNGDAIRIGLGAGAQLDGYNNNGIFDGGIAGVDWNHHLYAPDIQIARQPWLQVDTMGDRQIYDNPDWLKPLDTPPFYGQCLGCMMYSTRCCLSINENQQVIAKNGELIPGLYAAGMTSGRPANCVCGDVGYGATSAYLAAKDIVAQA